jgi:hypothetical protein
MKDSGYKVKSREKVDTSGLTAKFMKVTSKTTTVMDLESSITLMVRDMKVGGRRETSMVKARISSLMAQCTK